LPKARRNSHCIRALGDRHVPASRRFVIARGSKAKYTDKQKRTAEHIEEGYETRGVPEEEAERRAWATVNKETGGGKKSGSGRGKPESQSASRKRRRS
jgi:plasmid stabilization system protein ParE